MRTTPSSPVGLHRVTDPAGAALPQAARVIDATPELWPDEVLIAVETLNLDAASFRQLSEKHAADGAAVRAEVLDIVATRGKMQNPVTGSGGMLIGTVAEVGPESPLGLSVGDRVATLVSLSLTPLTITDAPVPLGRPLRAGARAGHRGAVRPLDRRPTSRRPLARPGPDGDGRLRRSRPRGAGRGGVRRARRGSDRGRAGRGREVRLAVARRGP